MALVPALAATAEIVATFSRRPLAVTPAGRGDCSWSRRCCSRCCPPPTTSPESGGRPCSHWSPPCRCARRPRTARRRRADPRAANGHRLRSRSGALVFFVRCGVVSGVAGAPSRRPRRDDAARRRGSARSGVPRRWRSRGTHVLVAKALRQVARRPADDALGRRRPRSRRCSWSRAGRSQGSKARQVTPGARHRRCRDGEPGRGDRRSSASSSLSAVFAFAVVKSANGRRAGNDPWRADTLEWYTTSPPPPDNFPMLPPSRAPGRSPICVRRALRGEEKSAR